LSHKRAYIEAQVALHWGLKPWEFRELLEPIQKAELMALLMIERECDDYYQSESERISEEKERQRKWHDDNKKPKRM